MGDMPILPKLNGAAAKSPAAADAPPPETTEGAATPLASIDELSDEEFGSLLKAAQEGDGVEVDEDAQAKQEAETIAMTAQVCEQESTQMVEAMEGLLAEAEASEDGDPKKIKKLMKDAESELKDCQKALEKALKAADKGKVDEATKQSELCEGHAAEISKLFEEAKGLTGAAAPAAAPPAGAPASPASPDKAASPLATWANRT